MKIVFLFVCLLAFGLLNAQPQEWIKYRFDLNLAVEMPANVEKGPPMAAEQYSYKGVVARIDSAIYVVMVGTSKEEIHVNNQSDYNSAIRAMAKGAYHAAEDKNWTSTMTDIECDSIPGIKMDYTGKLNGRNATGVNYFFLVNGLSYSLNAVFFKDELSSEDSTDLNRFISSINFPADIREMQFGSRAGYIGYSLGRLTQLAIMVLIIVGVVAYVIRNI